MFNGIVFTKVEYKTEKNLIIRIPISCILSIHVIIMQLPGELNQIINEF
jgi:hypothetical protein